MFYRINKTHNIQDSNGTTVPTSDDDEKKDKNTTDEKEERMQKKQQMDEEDEDEELTTSPRMKICGINENSLNVSQNSKFRNS